MANPPSWFRICAILSALWMAFGCFSYLMEAQMSAEALATLPEVNRQIITGRPTWAMAAFALAVWGGLAGTSGLVLRRGWSVPVLGLALLATLIAYIWPLLLSGLTPQFAVADWILSITILIVQFALYWLARTARDRNWLT